MNDEFERWFILNWRLHLLKKHAPQYYREVTLPSMQAAWESKTPSPVIN